MSCPGDILSMYVSINLTYVYIACTAEIDTDVGTQWLRVYERELNVPL